MATHYEQAGPKAHRGLLGPAWRMKLAQSIFRRPPQRQPGGHADRWFDDLCGYLALASDGDAGLLRARAKYPTIFQACELQEQPASVSPLKIMVVSDMALGEVQQRLGVEIAVVEAWEQIFYDVRDLRSASSWFAAHVIEPERAAGNLELVSELKLALGGGPVAARAILDCNETLPLDEADRLFQQKLKLSMKFDQAVEMPLTTNQDSLKFLRLYMQVELETKRLELASHKLQQRCDAQRDRHELAKMRIELAAKRAAQQAAGLRGQPKAGDRHGSYEPYHQSHAVDPLSHGPDGNYVAGQDLQPLVQLAQLRWAVAAQAPDAAAMRTDSVDSALAQSPAGAEDQPEPARCDELLLDPLDQGLECLPAGRLNGELVCAR